LRSRVKFSLALVFIFLAVLPLFGKDFFWSGRSSLFDRPPAPYLVSPIYDEVSICGGYLEFKWYNTFRGIDRYEFRLYKGSQMYQKNLLFKKVLPFSTASIKVEANLFESNQVYTWSLIQIASSGEKSEKSFITFRVIKK
jgi:hypothetical protein